MPRITLKETITKKIEISMASLNELVDNLTEEERAMLLARLQKTNTVSLKTFKKDKMELILADFEKTELYENDFLNSIVVSRLGKNKRNSALFAVNLLRISI